MRRKPLALLSAALLLSPSPASERPAGRHHGRRPAAAPRGRAGRPRSRSSGRYLAGRVAEQDHDYDAGADQFDLALAQTPGDLELRLLRLPPAPLCRPHRRRPRSSRRRLLATRPSDGLRQSRAGGPADQEGRLSRRRAAGRQDRRRRTSSVRCATSCSAWLKAGAEGVPRRARRARQAQARQRRAPEAPALVIEAQIDEMAGDKAAAEAKYRRAVALDPSGVARRRSTRGRRPAPARQGRRCARSS